jgi:hypothetical protein
MACITACGTAARGTAGAEDGVTALIAEDDWMIGINTQKAADTISEMAITVGVDTIGDPA